MVERSLLTGLGVALTFPVLSAAAVAGLPPARGQETHAAMSVVLGFLASLVNLPALSVPAGLPVGLQVIGPRHREDLVLAACHEAARRWPRHCPDAAG